MEERFNCAVFYVGGRTVYAGRYMALPLALNLAREKTHNAAARTGLTQRVILTDSDDHTVFEWQYGKGVTFPTLESRVEVALKRHTPSAAALVLMMAIDRPEGRPFNHCPRWETDELLQHGLAIRNRDDLIISELGRGVLLHIAKQNAVEEPS